MHLSWQAYEKDLCSSMRNLGLAFAMSKLLSHAAVSLEPAGLISQPAGSYPGTTGPRGQLGRSEMTLQGKIYIRTIGLD